MFFCSLLCFFVVRVLGWGQSLDDKVTGWFAWGSDKTTLPINLGNSYFPLFFDTVIQCEITRHLSWDIVKSRSGKNVYFPANWAKFPSSRADFPLVCGMVSLMYLFIYFFPPNHKISWQGASCFACFFPGLVKSSPWVWIWKYCYLKDFWFLYFYVQY